MKKPGVKVPKVLNEDISLRSIESSTVVSNRNWDPKLEKTRKVVNLEYSDI
jgi:hypothetical protein